MQTVCVIDQNKMYVDFVVKNEDGSLIGYELQSGETVVKTSAPNMKFLRPKWDGSQWVETATAEEIEEWEKEQEKLRGEQLPNPADELAIEMTEQQIEDLRMAQHQTNMLVMQLFNGGAK